MRLHDSRWIVVTCLMAACSPESPTGDDVPNQAPTVWVAADAPQSAPESYSVRLYWGGTDPDGKVTHYEYLIVENVTGAFNPDDIADATWTPIPSNESTFEFAEASPAATPTRAFVIRAVDNEMLPSLSPDYIAFTPKTVLPRVRITVPAPDFGLTPAAIPPVSTFEWSKDPPHPAPDSVQWALVNTAQHNNSYSQTIDYLRGPASAPDWYPWVQFNAPADEGTSWTTPPLDFGDYVFAVRGKDEEGEINPILVEPVNVRRAKVLAPGSVGPVLTVHNPLLPGRIVGTGCEFPITMFDVAAHLPLKFAFSACAGFYGGEIAGYRYGWDILDHDDPDQWEADYAPYRGPVTIPPRAFEFGTHTFSVEVIDNLGNCSRVEARMNVVRFTGERNLLIVDDYRADEFAFAGWAATNGALPNDVEHDNFWLDMVSDVDQFDPAVDMIATSRNNQIPITTLARYKSIVWSAFSDVDSRNVSELPSLYAFIRYRSTRFPKSRNDGGVCQLGGGVSGTLITDAIALAMQSGVHVLLTGNHPIQNVVPRAGGTTPLRWPMIPLYELEPGSTQTGTEPTFFADPPGERGFAYRELCLEAIDFALLTSQRARLLGPGLPPNQRYCAINGWRTPNSTSLRDDTMRGATPFDPNFPAISLRAEAAAPGKVYQPSARGLDVEVYNPAYFRQGAACEFVPAPRTCFEPIYGLTCLDAAELTYNQPVAFWTSAYADVIGQDIPGAVMARSAVFGFPPVYFNPAEVKPGIEYILFDEWQLPRSPVSASAR